MSIIHAQPGHRKLMNSVLMNINDMYALQLRLCLLPIDKKKHGIHSSAVTNEKEGLWVQEGFRVEEQEDGV